MQFGRPAYIVQSSGVEEGVNPEQLAKSVDAAQGKPVQEPNSAFTYLPMRGGYPVWWPPQSWMPEWRKFGQKNVEYSWLSSLANCCFIPCVSLPFSKNQRLDDNYKHQDIETPKSLRLLQLNIFVLAIIFFIQMAWSTDYRNHWHDTSNNLRKHTIPMILPPNMEAINVQNSNKNIDAIDWNNDNSDVIKTKYKDMLLNFSPDLKATYDTTGSNKKETIYQAAERLAKYMDTTCFFLYDMVLLQNDIMHIFAWVFAPVLAFYCVIAVCSHSFLWANKLFNKIDETTQTSSDGTETMQFKVKGQKPITKYIEGFIIVWTTIAELVIIIFGLTSIFFFVYNDASVNIWTKQNIKMTNFRTGSTPVNMDKMHGDYADQASITEQYNTISPPDKYRCFDINSDEVFNKNKEVKDALKEVYATGLENFKDKYLPFQKIPPGRPKLMWDIIIAGFVLFLMLIRVFALTWEYIHNIGDINSTNQMYGGLGVRAAVPQASYAYAPPGVFVMQ